MLKRIGYTLKMAWRYRQDLGTIARNKSLATTQIQPQYLQQQAKVLVLDFDGVLAAHGAIAALPTVEKWLDQCVQHWGIEQIFILSNKPMPSRIAYFAKRYPKLRFITGVAKKPYPDGLRFICERYGFQAKELVLLDDRLLTGMLASCIAGTQAIYIYPAYRDFKAHPIKEGFFAGLRLSERQFLRWF